MPEEDKRTITIYEVDKTCDPLKGKNNILQACYDHVDRTMGNSMNTTKIMLSIDSNKFPDFNTKGIYGHNNSGSISWIDYINNSLSSPIDNSSNHKHMAVIFLEHKTSNNIYAISFGMAYYLIKELLSDNFGLDILSRIIDPNKPYCKKSTAQSFTGKIQGEINVYREFQTLDDNIGDFGKIFQELFAIIDEDKLKKFGINRSNKSKRNLIKGCLAKDSFKINSQYKIDEINALLNGCEWAKMQQPNMINSVKILDKKNDKVDIEALDKKFYDSIYNKYLDVKGEYQGTDTPYQYDLCNKEFEKYLTAESAHTTGNHKSIKFKHVPITIDELFEKVSFKNKEELIKWMENRDITTFDINGAEQTKDKIKKHIFAEEAYNNQQHFLANGKWFRLDNKFIKFLENKIKHVYSDMMIANNTFLNNWNNASDETKFIKTHKEKSNCICIHPNLSENIELCDIMNWDEDNLYLYFIKDKFGNEIRSLSSQVLLSSQRIARELHSQIEYIKIVYKNIHDKQLTELTENEFVDLFTKKKVISVFAFHDTINREPLKDSPDNFGSNIAKYSLVHLINDMSQFNNIKLKLHQIPD